MSGIYGPKFQAARLRVLERDEHRCRFCDHDGSVDRLEVHHRHYRDGSDPKDEDLITLCVSCHDVATDKIRRDRYTAKALTQVVPDSIMVSVGKPILIKATQDVQPEEFVENATKPIFVRRKSNV